MKNSRSVRIMPTSPPKKVRKKDMTTIQLRDYERARRQRRLARKSHQKRAADRLTKNKKERDRYRKKRLFCIKHKPLRLRLQFRPKPHYTRFQLAMPRRLASYQCGPYLRLEHLGKTLHLQLSSLLALRKVQPTLFPLHFPLTSHLLFQPLLPLSRGLPWPQHL